MARFFVTAQRVTDYTDLVEADTLEEAKAIVREWIDEDHAIISNAWTVDIAEVE